MNSYQRAVRNYLVEMYHVNPGLPVGGGSHDAFKFEYGGRQRRITLHHGTDETNAYVMKLQDIRRELGPPPRPKEEPEEKMVEKSGEEAFVAAYRGNKPGSLRVRFSIPRGLAEPFLGRAISVEAQGEENWVIRAHSDASITKPKFREKGVAIGYSDLEAPLIENCFGQPFGKSPAEVVVVDGSLLIHSDPAKRVPVMEVHRGSKRAVEPDNVEAALHRIDPASLSVEAPAVILAAQSLEVEHQLTEEEMLGVLRTLRTVEREGKYELVRTVSGRWEFRPRARTIRLED